MGMSRIEAGRLGGLAAIEFNRKRKEQRVADYLANPKLCKECSAVIPYQGNIDRKVFCNHSCSAKNFNRKRSVLTKTNNCIDCGSVVTRRAKRCLSCQASRRKSTLDTVKCPNRRRRLLIKERGHRCESCKNEIWLGQPIPLEIDHINGNYSDNYRENLRLLCPTCHALTPTYKNKNKGHGRSFRKKYYLN